MSASPGQSLGYQARCERAHPPQLPLPEAASSTTHAVLFGQFTLKVTYACWVGPALIRPRGADRASRKRATGPGGTSAGSDAPAPDLGGGPAEGLISAPRADRGPAGAMGKKLKRVGAGTAAGGPLPPGRD